MLRHLDGDWSAAEIVGSCEQRCYWLCVEKCYEWHC